MTSKDAFFLSFNVCSCFNFANLECDRIEQFLNCVFNCPNLRMKIMNNNNNNNRKEYGGNSQ